VGLLLFFGLPAIMQVPSSARMPGPINFCTSYNEMCTEALHTMQCPAGSQVISGCAESSNPASYIGICECGEFTVLSDRVSELLIDSQLKANFAGNTMMVWPTQPSHVPDPTLVLDTCLTFEKNCAFFLERINCPSGNKVNFAGWRDVFVQIKKIALHRLSTVVTVKEFCTP
jgi:hypothetical protein